MLSDRYLNFTGKSGQSITGTAVSTNVVSLGALGTPPLTSNAVQADIGKGQPVPIRVQIMEAFDNLTSLRVEVEQDTDEAFPSPTTVGRSVEKALADCTADEDGVFEITALPRGITESWLRLKFVVTGTNPTTGKVFGAVVTAVSAPHPW